MTTVTVIYALGFYFATAVLIFGLGFKVWQFATTPAPLKIPVTPAPLTQAGVAWRLTKEVTVFASLFKSNLWIWGLSMLFHGALVLVLLRHLRYFIEPVWTWVVLIQPFGLYAGFGMVAGLLGLWARRFLVERIRYISKPSDHLMLMLLIGIGASGLMMKFVARTDIIQLKSFFLGLLYFDWQTMPTDTALLVHLGLVLSLMIIFPFSKLLHVPGMFFMPSRNQVDDARERRHLVPWVSDMISQSERGSSADKS